MNFHPACLKLPKMAAHEYAALVESVKQGWDNRYPILTLDGLILDGRHRFLACRDAGKTPTFVEWDRARCGGNPFRFVWQEHDARRSWLSAEQRQLCYDATEEAAADWDAERKRIDAEANAARSDKAKAQIAQQDRDDKGRLKPGSSTVSATNREKRKGHEKGAKSKAEKAGTNRGAVQRTTKMRRLAQELGKPEVIEAVMQGEMKANAALRSLEEERRKVDLARPVKVDLHPGVHRGDFRELAAQIPDESVELVFTDPPYDADSVGLYEDAARVAARILKPGGSFIAYSGQTQLPTVLANCSKHLRYWWTIAGVHSGGNQLLQKLGIRCGWKPLVWFVKQTRGDVQSILLDVVTGEREKDAHRWQQAEAEACYYIQHLTSPHGVVVDFFLGGGTTAVAAQKLGRPWIGFEVDASAAERASNRLSKEAA